MRISRFPIATLKETPAEAEVVSHKLMLRAGLIRRLASGLYTWTPLGLRVLRKVEAIVREEMNRAGALELLMPAVQPAELWQESGRWEQMGEEMLRLRDRHAREFCFGPTHEEVITDFVRREVQSYKQLPVNYYQIQTKFRDERRPRFGVMRAREFLMKDAYSFHATQESLVETYEAMYEAYTRIFTRLGLNFRAVLADTGAIGGSGSHEFHVLAQSGEDVLAVSDAGDYAANVEMAEALPPAHPRAAPAQEMRPVDTPGAKTIADLAAQFGVPADGTVKTLVVHGADGGLLALLLRGDHELNEIKAAKLPAVASPLVFATEEEIRAAIGVGPGSLGPVGLDIPAIADRAVAAMSNFCTGANVDGKHHFGVNWERDVALPELADLRNVVEGDPSPDGEGRLYLVRGIEVGHVFQLGDKYSRAMNATCLDEQGRAQVMIMGCYGIGVSRIVAAAIEQHHDERGIVWPLPIAPFQVALLPMGMHKSQRLREAVENLYRDLLDAGIEVLLDDRDARPGVMFADAELLGIPQRIVFSEKGLDAGTLEYRGRRDAEAVHVPATGIVAFLRERP